MRKVGLSLASAFLAGVAVAAPSHAALVADFELNGSLDNTAGTGATLANNGGVLGTTGIAFDINQGPVINGLGALSAYTIDISFEIDNLNGPRGNGYVKLIDFSNLQSDSGYYSHGGFLEAYPLGNSPDPVFSAGTQVRLTLSRDNTGLITAYIDGTEIYSKLDPTNSSGTLIDGISALTFFSDDRSTAFGEASSGSVDYIRIYDSAVTPGEATPAPVPEPATWAMFITGFGLTGAAMRRRRTILRFA